MGSVASVAGYLAATAALVVSSMILVGGRGRRTASRCYLALALATIAPALALAAPITLAATASIEPIPNITRLVGDTLAMLGAWCVLAMLAHTVGSPATRRSRIRWQAGILVASVAVMTTLLAAARTRFTVEFANTYATDPSATVYEVLYVSYMCWGMISFVWLIRRYAIRECDQIMRIGLWISVVAAVLGLAWAAWKVANIVVVIVVGHPVDDQASVSELLAAAVVGLVAAGVSLPSWARGAVAFVARYRAWRSYRALTPLWTVLIREVPQVALPDTGVGDGIEYALYRRVIEIRDAQLALRPYIPPDLPGLISRAVREAGMTAGEANCVIEATELAASITAHRAGHNCRTDAVRIGGPRQGTPADVYAEARWLAGITRAMRRNTLVAELAQRALAEQSLRTNPT